MGSELEGGGGVGVPVAKVDAGQSGYNSIEIRPSVDACSQRGRFCFSCHTCGIRNCIMLTGNMDLPDKIPAANATEPAFQKRMPDTRYFLPKDQPSSFHMANGFENFDSEEKNGSVSLITGLDSKQLHQRSEKVARSNSGSSKRSRIVQMEVSVNESAVDNIKGYSTDIGSRAAKSVVAEKTQMPRQKNNANGKRGDKRTGKIPKSRCETFSLKNGLVGFSTVTGENIPAYGSKSNIFDVSKYVDELPLNELLDGSHNCPSLVKDKGKRVKNSNENFMNSVRKACSILRIQSHVHEQNSAERENNCNQKVSMGTVSTGASSASRTDGGKGDHYSVNQPSANKLSFEDKSCGRINTLTTTVELPLYPPKDILERLSLPPSKDLDSLLLDAVKPASSSRNTDLRFGKTVSHRTGLPPFPWSHNSSGHSKSGPDTVKLTANRTTCQGRWVKVENSLAAPLKDSTGFLVDLKSFTYDHSLVPIGNLESGPLGSGNIPSSYMHFSSSERVLSSSAACSASQVPQGELSPGLLAAAKTLCQIAAHPSKQISNGMLMMLKRPSQKIMKACKSKLNEKSQRLFGAPKPSARPDDLIKVADGILPSKKLRLSIDKKTVDVCHTNPPIKGSMNWSTPRSIRSSPSKLLRDLVPETKNCPTNTVKKSYMMPPPARVIDKSFSSQQKLKKIVPME